MDPTTDRAELSTCTTCTFPDDFSNYWTAALYFRARNGSYKRVPQAGALFHETARGGGITIYYFPPRKDPTNIVAFKRGFRMRTGNPDSRTNASQGIDYTCLLRDDTRYTNRTVTFPDHPCPVGIITTLYFPPCWDGVNLDSPDHYSHVAWPAGGAAGYDDGEPCPATHPVKIPQVVLEVQWDTREFNDPELWPEDGSQPFVWSFGDTVGYGHHGDYVFGWRGNSLDVAFSDDEGCLGVGNTLCQLNRQSIEKANECMLEPSVKEDVDGWLEKMPGGVEADIGS
jgi:hypothetical protein